MLGSVIAGTQLHMWRSFRARQDLGACQQASVDWAMLQLCRLLREVPGIALGRLSDWGSAPCTGAVAVRMRVYDTGISLVNCHLSSGQNEGDSLRRHTDYAEIMRRGAFPPDGQSTDLDVSLAGAEADEVMFACQTPAFPIKGYVGG